VDTIKATIYAVLLALIAAAPASAASRPTCEKDERGIYQRASGCVLPPDDRAVYEAVVEICADKAHVRAFVRPDDSVTYLGNLRQQFEFQKCMNDAGAPLRPGVQR